MSVQATRFLTALAQTLSTMSLYGRGHPSRARALDVSFQKLSDLLADDARPSFSFLGEEVVYGETVLRELKRWDWSAKLVEAGIQRLEMDRGATREEWEGFVDEAHHRMAAGWIDTAEMRPAARTRIRYGSIGIRGEKPLDTTDNVLPTATISYTLREEADTVRWLHQEVIDRDHVPILEAEAVVRSLSVAMHGESQVILPLLYLKTFDQYTTTHSMNVAVLTMALAEYMQLHANEVRAFGVAGLLHDLGKVRVPTDILTKPGALTDEEREVIRQHPVDGARIIFASDRRMDLASVVAYEHHIMLNGGGYPRLHYPRDCHPASKLVHVVDVYDAMRTRRPYRAEYETEVALAYIEQHAGTEFEPDVARAFASMMRTWERRVASLEREEEESAAVAAAVRAAAATNGAPRPADETTAQVDTSSGGDESPGA